MGWKFNPFTGKFDQVGGGGGGTPGGSDGQMQYNNGGVFGGDAYSFYDDTTGIHQFGDVGSGSTTEIDNTGFITQYKDARTWRECIARWEVPVAWMDANVAPIWTDGFAGGREEGFWGFDMDVEGLQKVSFTFELPHDYDEGTDLYPHVHFSNPITQEPEKLAAVWIMHYWFADVFKQDGAGAGISNFETNGQQVCYMYYQYGSEISLPLTAWTHLKTQIDGEGYHVISGEGLKISSIIKGIVYLDIRSTTFQRQLALLSIDLHYQANTLGSREERAKGTFGIGTPRS